MIAPREVVDHLDDLTTGVGDAGAAPG